MLLWQLLVRDARKIARDPDAARAWVHRHLPELLLRSESDDGTRYTEESFDWESEWGGWQRNLEALVWLDRARGTRPGQKRRLASPSRIPLPI